MRRRLTPSPTPRRSGGAARRRRFRHSDAERPVTAVRRRPRARGDIEDFIYETWGVYASPDVSER